MKIDKVFKYFKLTLSELVKFFIVNFPGSTGRRIRYIYYKRRFKSCGKNVLIDEGVIITNPQWITMGDNVWIDNKCILIAGKENLEGKILKRKENKRYGAEEGELVFEGNNHIAPYCLIQSIGGVYLENGACLSSGCKVYSLSTLPNNPFDPYQETRTSPTEENQSVVPYLISPVVMRNNSWASLHCIILPGVTIGENSFIRANSVVYTDLSPNSYAAGDPAKVVRKRFKMEKKFE